MEHLLNRFKKYQEGTYASKKGLLEGLANGQSPKSFLITCADSRINVAEFTQSEAGEVFVIRNAGNIVDAYDPANPTNEALTLEYGVSVLGVEEVIVCGHASCGAMGALKAPETLDALPLVQKRILEIAKSFDENMLREVTVDQLIVENVKKQMSNILSFPFVQEKVKEGKLKVWGWVYDFVGGDITTKISHEEL